MEVCTEHCVYTPYTVQLLAFNIRNVCFIAELASDGSVH